MKALFALCLAVSIATVAATHTHQASAPRSTHINQSSAPRSFLFYFKEKMRNVCLEIEEMKKKINECCNQAAIVCNRIALVSDLVGSPEDRFCCDTALMNSGCTYNERTHTHGSVFMAPDNCNLCRCSDGSVTCTNSSGCHPDIGGSSYNYKDQLAQAYCASKAIGLAEHTSAVRRNCDLVTSNQTCNDICVTGSTFATSIDARFPDARFSNFECTGAVWLMMDHPVLAPNPGPGQTDAGLLNMVTISYDNCENTDCGPSYCCCVAYFEPDG